MFFSEVGGQTKSTLIEINYLEFLLKNYYYLSLVHLRACSVNRVALVVSSDVI